MIVYTDGAGVVLYEMKINFFCTLEPIGAYRHEVELQTEPIPSDSPEFPSHGRGSVRGVKQYCTQEEGFRS